MKHIYFTVTTDLTYDQRMQRICHSLAMNGFKITLVGRILKTSKPLQQTSFHQFRIRCFFNKGFLFYLEYNMRLFFFLLFKKMDAVCAVDLDTILPVLFVSAIKRIPRIYDAHEYFTELKEVRTRSTIKKIWLAVEKFAVPKFKYCYTVSEGLADVFEQKYKTKFLIIVNAPLLVELPKESKKAKVLLYQGAVNEGRGFEYLIPAMQKINYNLIVCGDGNFMIQLKKLVKEYVVEEKIELKGMMTPAELRQIAPKASLGMGLAEKEGTNQFLALPNKFFDYMHAGVPQIAMNYPEYKKINDQYKVAILLDDLSIDKIATTINDVMSNEELLEEMHQNCLAARKVYNWQAEEKKLISFYHSIFSPSSKK